MYAYCVQPGLLPLQPSYMNASLVAAVYTFVSLVVCLCDRCITKRIREVAQEAEWKTYQIYILAKIQKGVCNFGCVHDMRTFTSTQAICWMIINYMTNKTEKYCT